MTERARIIEATAKKWKLQQLIGLLICFAGALVERDGRMVCLNDELVSAGHAVVYMADE